MIRGQLRLEVVEEIGPVQRRNLEVLFPELVLRQQGREDKDRIIAAGPGLGVIHLWQVATARLHDAAFRSTPGRCGNGHRLIGGQRVANCVF